MSRTGPGLISSDDPSESAAAIPLAVSPSPLLSFSLAGLPTAGTAGRLADVTDSVGGIHKDTGTQWIQIAGGVINVKDRPFGAKGDGTTDDTVAIQAAIDAASNAVGGIVWLPKGAYKVTTLNFKPRVQLVGSGWQGVNSTDSTVLVGTAGSDVIQLTPVGGVKSPWFIRDLVISGGENGIVSDATSHVPTFMHIERVRITDPIVASIHIKAGSIEEWWLKDVRLFNGQYGFRKQNVAVGGSSYIDKSTFINVQTGGQTVNGWRLEALLGGTNTWINPIIGSAGQDGVWIDGGLTSLVFINTNTEANGQTGKKNRTTGSITTGTNSLTVASATGYAVSDPVVVAGAGANSFDLFSSATAIVGSVITLADNASTTVASANVTNASYDDFHFEKTIATPAQITFIGGNIGGEATAGALRYSIYNAGTVDGLNLFGLTTNINIPIYDQSGTTYNFGGNLTIRHARTITNAVPRYAMIAPATTTSELVRTMIPSPPGKDLVMFLRDSLDTGAGNFGLYEWRKFDANRTRLARLNADGRFILDRGETVAGFVNAGSYLETALSPAQLIADQNDYNPGGSGFWRLSSDAARTITGIVGEGGRNLKIINVGSFNIVLANQNASSAVANRIITGTGADITLAADDTAQLIYDGVTQRWRVINTH